MQKTEFDQKQKFTLILCKVSLVGNDRDQTIRVGLHQVCTLSASFVHSYRFSQELRCFGIVTGKQTLNSLHGFLFELRSRDWLENSKTLRGFLCNHLFVAQAKCLGSLSCWKSQPCSILNALTDRRILSKISPYMDPNIIFSV